MSRTIPSFMSGSDAWLPPPSAWRVFACQRCEAEMRVPFPPSDKLCGDCRANDRRAAEKTLEERLAEAGAPRKFAACTRRHWERRYGAWAEHAELRRLVGWPHEHALLSPSGDQGGETPRSWLVLLTGPGYGARKTELATAVLGEAMSPSPKDGQRGLHGRWLTQADWLLRIKASWDGRRTDQLDVDPEHVVWRQAADAEVLLFDDFGGFGGCQKPEKAWWRPQVAYSDESDHPFRAKRPVRLKEPLAVPPRF